MLLISIQQGRSTICPILPICLPGSNIFGLTDQSNLFKDELAYEHLVTHSAEG
jgi:hypothetical protein